MLNLGYFHRPLSTGIFLGIVVILLSCYLVILLKSKEIFEKNLWKWIILSIIILLPSYPAFSHDIFNYIFDARIITFYHQNPWTHTALDFPDDLWTRFMHWTHRAYPYGPSWLLISLIPSFLGFHKFVLTLFNFKLMFTGFHLGNIFLIGKIMDRINPKLKTKSLIFYAFNPLILIESLISPHNEVLMLFFLLLALYLSILQSMDIKRKSLWIAAILAILASIGVKFITAILLPVFAWLSYQSIKNKSKKWPWFKIIRWTVCLLILSLVFVIYEREPYPWYLITIIGLVSLIVNHKFLYWLTITFSLGVLLRYAPFLYFGDYGYLTKHFQLWLTILPFSFYFFSRIIKYLSKEYLR